MLKFIERAADDTCKYTIVALICGMAKIIVHLALIRMKNSLRTVLALNQDGLPSIDKTLKYSSSWSHIQSSRALHVPAVLFILWKSHMRPEDELSNTVDLQLMYLVRCWDQIYLTQSEEVCWTTSHLSFSDILQPQLEPDQRWRSACN